jgi:hypothetical protein
MRARWRSVALDTPQNWTILTFRKHPRLAQAKEYISRSNGLALSIKLDCVPEGGYQGLDENVLSLPQLDQILDLLEPAISHWGNSSSSQSCTITLASSCPGCKIFLPPIS